MIIVSPPPSRPRMQLISWKPVTADGTLKGFATVWLPNGLVISDCPVHLGSRGPWAALPGRPIIDDLGRHAVDPAGPGKRLWAAIGYWDARELTDGWSAAIVALVRGVVPEALS